MLETATRSIRKLVRKLRKKSRNAFQSGWNSNNYISFDSATTPSYSNVISYGNDGIKMAEAPKDTREVKKPVDVVGGLVIERPEIDLSNLDERIRVVKRRIKVLKEQSVSLTDENEALGYLLARKNFKRHGELFKWEVTTSAKVQELLRAYKLRLVSFGGYYKSIPNEALDEIEKFTTAYESVADDGQPYLELIVDEGGPEEKKDPILLARSPFGRWYYILGAWDKEVEYVDDLIYKGK